MSVPIDYIDLTTDLPDQPSKLRNKDEIFVNLTITKSRKRGSKKQVAQLEDSIMYVYIITLYFLNFNRIYLKVNIFLEK